MSQQQASNPDSQPESFQANSMDPGPSGFQVGSNGLTPDLLGHLLQTLIQLQQQNQHLFQQGQVTMEGHRVTSTRIEDAINFNSHTVHQLGDSFSNVSLALREPRATRTQGPKIKDPSIYNGDRSGD
ncbi:hypothetical protein LTR24_010169 [Lithohypha guttulata]|uniref:Uncharacterized protein n=1 Tax=Lithohypha guttulata TaxID=1690604 RepID=A0ABR0JV47_9EURO|nr:hypothetical protein LTR24_010169 [Lithohypha guttulata]